MYKSKHAPPDAAPPIETSQQSQPDPLVSSASSFDPQALAFEPQRDLPPGTRADALDQTQTYAPMLQVPGIDEAYDPHAEFAQTRSPDDLFGDDIEPVAHSVVEVPAQSQRSTDAIARRGGKRNNPRQTPTKARTGKHVNTSSAPEDGSTKNPEAKTAVESVSEPPREGSEPQPRKEQAVRGDRSATGGIQRAKLTEEELDSLMSSISLKTSRLEADFARAEADAQSFAEREAVNAHRDAQRRKHDGERQRAERQNRQQMMGEREKNRQRKLQALGGREWDADKPEDELTRTRGSRYTRGVHGGMRGGSHIPSQSPDNEGQYSQDYEERRPYPRGRGRGRGGGRGQTGPSLPAHQLPTGRGDPQLTEAAFPALPGSRAVDKSKSVTTSSTYSGALAQSSPTTKETESNAKPAGSAQDRDELDSAALSQSVDKGSWAEQVEAAG